MGYYSTVAIALDKSDYNRLARRAKENENVKGTFVEEMILYAESVKTPDETYMILSRDFVKWYHEFDHVKFIMDFITPIRHSFLRIGEDNFIEEDIKVEDDRGEDDEFYDILSPSVKINVFGKELEL